MSIGEKLKALRLQKGCTLQVVADGVGCSKTHIWDMENGKTNNPGFSLVINLAKYFCVMPSYFCEDKA